MPPQDTPQQPQQPFTPADSGPSKKVGKFKGSIRIVQESWSILRQDKEILWFPILSLVTSVLALGLFATLFFYAVLGGNFSAFDAEMQQAMGPLDYALLIMFYTLMYYIVNFFQAGIYIIAHARMQGDDLTFMDGIRGAQQSAGKIFLWSLINATVGVVLRAIAERSRLIGRIVVALLGAAWGILTYFSLPSLVIGKTSVVGSFKMSAATIRKMWGETIIVNLGVGLIFMLIFLAGLVLGITAIIILPGLLTFISVVGLLFVFLLALSIVSSALGAIFKLALFEYARTGVVPQGFSADLIEAALKGKGK